MVGVEIIIVDLWELLVHFALVALVGDDPVGLHEYRASFVYLLLNRFSFCCVGLCLASPFVGNIDRHGRCKGCICVVVDEDLFDRLRSICHVLQYLPSVAVVLDQLAPNGRLDFCRGPHDNFYPVFVECSTLRQFRLLVFLPLQDSQMLL